MTRRFYLGLFLAGLLIATAAASLERVPGYMDADFYYAGALRLTSGQGASEPYLWNYLNDPSAIPAPSFSYWMPLSSLLAALGLTLARPLGFWGARLGFILLTACIPPLTALLAYRLSGKPASARLGGLLALFPAFYLAYLPTTDAFPISMVLGGLFVLLAFDCAGWLAKSPVALRLFSLGVLCGLMHLTRADGLLWLVGAGFAALYWTKQNYQPRAGANLARFMGYVAVIITGYGLTLSPWLLHNLRGWGSLFPPGGSRALWVTEYEQTMLFPASLLNLQHWLAVGWGSHLRAWGEALLTNFQTSVAVQGHIILLPFILISFWKLRDCAQIRLGALMYLVTAGAMTLAFPFAGMNGGFFHSGAALQPLFWAAAPVGVETAMLWYARKRRMGRPQRMVSFMAALLVGVMVLLSGFLYVQRVVGPDASTSKWSESSLHYQAVEKTLVSLGAKAGDPVLVNNPPGYWLASGRPAVVIPDGDEQMLLAAARRYQVGYLVLEVTNPRPLGNLYHARVNPPELKYLTSVGSTRLYQVEQPR